MKQYYTILSEYTNGQKDIDESCKQRDQIGPRCISPLLYIIEVSELLFLETRMKRDNHGGKR